jgi:predicted ribosome quality control (RQC) complex YloA/Tae2 family protein
LFDTLTIAAIADELTEHALDGRIQRIGLADSRTLAAEIYAGGRRRTLVASASDSHARLLLTDTNPAIDAELVTPFSLLLRKHARGGVIVGIEQPPLERMVRISIAKRQRPHNRLEPTVSEEASASAVPPEVDEELDDDEVYGLEDASFVHLYVEIMGRHSNLILVSDDGRIMESVKRVTRSMSRVRQVLPRLPYMLPPPMNLPDPRQVKTGDIETLLGKTAQGGDLARTLVRSFRGISPQMAREIVYRAGDSEDTAATIAREMRRLLEPLLTSSWEPCVYRDESDEAVAFSPIPFAHLREVFREERTESISQAAEVVEGGEPGSGRAGRHGQRRERLAVVVREARDRTNGKLDALSKQSAVASEAERWKTWGELIYGYLWAIEPGQAELDADGVRVPLDPKLSAKENAQEYFERYRKAQSAGDQIPVLIEKVEADLAYLDQLLTQIGQAETYAEIEALTAEWESTRSGEKRKTSKPRSVPLPKRPKALLDSRGNAVYVGRSGAQNDAVTFDVASPDDTWLHARGVPGSHVIVRWHGSDEDDSADTIEAASALAAYYSSARESGHVEVDITRRRHVRKIKGTGPGMVTYRNERTISVAPRSEAQVANVLRSGGEHPRS